MNNPKPGFELKPPWLCEAETSLSGRVWLKE